MLASISKRYTNTANVILTDPVSISLDKGVSETTIHEEQSWDGLKRLMQNMHSSKYLANLVSPSNKYQTATALTYAPPSE